jgi:SAM-dependent methyltransferase
MAVFDRPELAAAYREVRGLSDGLRRTWSATFRAALPHARPRRSLDLGCGAGRFTALLGEVFGGTVVGLDASLAMLGERPAAADATLAFAAADARALPLRTGSIDLALLSMVYHLLASPAATVAEVGRVLRGGGAVLVRTPTREILDRIAFLPFFPAARAIDEARMPGRAALEAVFLAAGFSGGLHATVAQEFAASGAAAFAKVRRRPFSSLQLMPDEAFAEGLARYEAFCRTAPPAALVDPLDVFVFHRA